MRKKITNRILEGLAVAALMIISVQLSAQNYEHAFGIGGIYEDEGRIIQVDGSKNVYLAGSYVDSVDFDPSTAPGDTANRQTSFAPNAFIAKYDSAGNFQWVSTIDGEQLIHIRDMELSPAGNLYVIGDFMDTARFKGTSSFNTHVSNGVFDVFIAKYDTTGQILWSKTFGGPAPDWGYNLAVDQNENVIVCGSFLISTDFDPSASGTASLNTIMGSPDIFLAKYDLNGDYIWAKNAGSSAMDEGLSVDVNRVGDIFLTGYTGDSSAFDSIGVSTRGANDIFLAKYNSQGTALWAESFGGPAPDKGTALKLSGNQILLGASYQAMAFMDNSASAPNHFSAGAEDMILAAYDTSGTHQWSKSFGGPLGDQINSLTTDFAGNIYLSGFFTDTADFAGGFGTAGIRGNGMSDIFMAKYYPDGKYIWAQAFGSANEDEGKYLYPTADKIYLTGFFQDTVDFNPSHLDTNNLIASTNGSVFLAKYDACLNNHSFDTTSICVGDSVQYNSKYSFNTSGIYHLRMLDSIACDTLITVIVESYDSINTQLTTNDPSITVNDSTSIYQWYDCSADTIISGENAQNFTATVNGTYAAIITDSLSGCSDTTNCVNIVSVGIREPIDPALRLKIFPNPTSGKLFIESEEEHTFRIHNQLGKVVMEGKLKKGSQTFNIHKLSPGVYFFITNNQSTIHKVVLQN
jgi:hypothetical protein